MPKETKPNRQMSEKEQTGLWRKVNEISKNVDRILLILENDDKTDTKGLVQNFRDLKKDVDKLKAYKKVLNAKFYIYVGIMSAIAFAVWQVILVVFKKIIG